MLVTSIENTGPSTRQRLRASTGESLVVLADPGSVVTDELGAELGFAVSEPVTRSAECTGAALAPVLDGLEIAVDRGVEYPAPAGCFFGEHGALLAQPEEGLVLLGAFEILRNDVVLRADNAAVALRLLGQRDRLVWYVPDFADLDSSEAVSLATLLPDWLRPGPVAGRAGDGRRAALARAPPGTAGHRAAARGGQGHRDHPEPGAALPQGGRPRPRRGGAAGGRRGRRSRSTSGSPPERRPRHWCATSPGTSADRWRRSVGSCTRRLRRRPPTTT